MDYRKIKDQSSGSSRMMTTMSRAFEAALSLAIRIHP